MKEIDPATLALIPARIDSLQKEITDCDEKVKLLQGYGGEYGRGIYKGYKFRLESEIRFLTHLLLALTKTVENPTENPNPSPEAEPGQ